MTVAQGISRERGCELEARAIIIQNLDLGLVLKVMEIHQRTLSMVTMCSDLYFRKLLHVSDSGEKEFGDTRGKEEWTVGYRNSPGQEERIVQDRKKLFGTNTTGVVLRSGDISRSISKTNSTGFGDQV